MNRHKEIVHEEVQHESPKIILAKLKRQEAEIAEDLERVQG